MEKSFSENEENQSFRSPPRRRRSTFFERRDSLMPQSSENEDPVSKKVTDVTDKHHQELLRYHDTLLGEKEQWKKELQERRHKYHDLRQQYEIMARASSRSRISYDALSNEDIEFLKAKVNISKLVESQTKLHKSVKEAYALFRRAMELDDVILSYSEDKVKKVTDYILDNSTIEPVD